MTTTRDIVSRALMRIRIVAPGEPVSADYAQVALDHLNAMLASLVADGVVITNAPFALADTFAFFVPPVTLSGETVDAITYLGDWNASTNSPSLATVPDRGSVYRVAVAGSTALPTYPSTETLSSWTVGDYVVSTGVAFYKGDTSTRFERGIIDMLATEIAPSFGREPLPQIVDGAEAGRRSLYGVFLRSQVPVFDRSLVLTPSRRFVGVSVNGNSIDGYDIDGVRS